MSLTGKVKELTERAAHASDPSDRDILVAQALLEIEKALHSLNSLRAEPATAIDIDEANSERVWTFHAVRNWWAARGVHFNSRAEAIKAMDDYDSGNERT